MTQTLQFRYYYKNQAEQFHFYKIPKVLFTDPRFKGLSAEAKILYGLMLDRMSLSMKNGWMDSQNRIYIYFTLEDALELMGCGQGKAVRLFAELDSVKGIGLIERKKQGQGKPAKIYVKNFLEDETADGGSDENKTSQNRTEIILISVRLRETIQNLFMIRWMGWNARAKNRKWNSLSAETLSMMFCFCEIHPVTGKSTRLFR